MLVILKEGQTIETDFFSARMYQDFLFLKAKDTKCISNAVFNGGIKKCSSLINYSLYGKGDCGGKPVAYISNILRGIDADPEETVGLLTAVRPDTFAYVNEGHTHCFVSLGLDNAASPLDGLSYSGRGINGTINIIVLTDLKLTDGALVDAYKTSVEAKSYSLLEKNIRSKYSSRAATGTITDVTAIVSSMSGEEYRFAGTGTDIGSEISRLINSAMSSLIEEFNWAD
ncbi:MAG: adenosylcobinamide amidohydrolase [Thermoplasmata archaeon]